MNSEIIDVIGRVEMLIKDYFRDTGCAPGGLAVGPKEYSAICQYRFSKERYLKDARVGGIIVTEYDGIPLYVKELGGIDIIISYDKVKDYL